MEIKWTIDEIVLTQSQNYGIKVDIADIHLYEHNGMQHNSTEAR